MITQTLTATSIATLPKPTGLLSLIQIWQMRIRTRAALAKLDAQMRADSGITRDQVIEECAKPFWRA